MECLSLQALENVVAEKSAYGAPHSCGFCGLHHKVEIVTP
jgi:hypothetical protein